MWRWEDDIGMDLEEIGINTRNWVVWADARDYWRALVNAVLNLRVVQGVTKHKHQDTFLTL